MWPQRTPAQPLTHPARGPTLRPAPFTHDFEGTGAAVRACLVTMRCHLMTRGAQRALANTAEIVLAEVLNNVVEHAYPHGRAGPIHLRMHTHPGSLRFEVRDGGLPFPGFALPSGCPPALCGPRQSLPERGFGWVMIRQLAQDLDYTRIGSQNRLRFALRRRDPALC